MVWYHFSYLIQRLVGEKSEMVKKAHIVAPTRWPIMGSFGFLFLMFGAIRIFHEQGYGWPVMIVGVLTLLGMITGWLSEVIQEHLNGLKNDSNLESSFRWE